MLVPSLKQSLVATGLFPEDQVTRVLERHQQSGLSIADTVVDLGLGDDEKTLSALAQALAIPFRRLGDLTVEKNVLEKVPARVVFQHLIIPVALTPAGELLVATCDPFAPDLLESLRLASGCEVRLTLATRADLEKALKKFYGVGADMLEQLIENDRVELSTEEDLFNKDIDEDDQEASVVKFVNQIIWEAHKNRATDIHLEPMETDLRIRYRVDGVLHQAPVPPQLKRFQSAIISRIKVMANMDIAEKRLPQDGRISVRIRGEEIDVRVNSMPTVYGESVSLRLLLRGSGMLGMDRLGLEPEDEKILTKLIHKPHGILLVTGPTGSGKSTSLYAWMHTINTIDKRIITTEDPIEYEMAGINQVQIRADIGLTFAEGLRNILRQDPDVIMVGEIRDKETAEIAIRAALTGHLVFSTLHTNDAAGAVTRLIDMGIEPFLVASSVEAIVAQRLVRRLCSACRKPWSGSPDVLTAAGFELERLRGHTIYEPGGCDTCNFSGFKGRCGIYEVMPVVESIRPLIIRRASAGEIKAEALRNGIKTLREDGWLKVLRGVTTAEEVIRVSAEDEELSGE